MCLFVPFSKTDKTHLSLASGVQKNECQGSSKLFCFSLFSSSVSESQVEERQMMVGQRNKKRT